MLSLGWQEMVVIFLVALVLFGPRKLPELGRTIGKAITEFRRASNELKATFDREMQQIERENESLKATTSGYLRDISGQYDSSYYDSDAYRYDSYDSSTTSDPASVSEPATPAAELSSSSESPVLAPAEGTVARAEPTSGAAEAGETSPSSAAEGAKPETAGGVTSA
jgi:TatA/E family protein of Tat protein translocase